MAGKIIVSTLQSDTDNSISFVANTGATIFSANLSNGIAGSFIGNGSVTNAKLAGSITGDKITPGQITGNLIATNAISQNNIVSVNASVASVGTLPTARLPTGSVLQVANATFATAQTTTSTSYQASGLTVSITPTANTSRIFISASVPADTFGGTSNQTSLTLYRGATDLLTNGFALIGAGGSNNLQPGNSALSLMDFPATTSLITYTIYHRVAPTASGTVVSRIFTDGYTGSITVMEIAG